MPFSPRGTISHCTTIEMSTYTAYRIYVYNSNNNNSITT